MYNLVTVAKNKIEREIYEEITKESQIFQMLPVETTINVQGQMNVVTDVSAPDLKIRNKGVKATTVYEEARSWVMDKVEDIIKIEQDLLSSITTVEGRLAYIERQIKIKSMSLADRVLRRLYGTPSFNGDIAGHVIKNSFLGLPHVMISNGDSLEKSSAYFLKMGENGLKMMVPQEGFLKIPSIQEINAAYSAMNNVWDTNEAGEEKKMFKISLSASYALANSNVNALLRLKDIGKTVVSNDTVTSGFVRDSYEACMVPFMNSGGGSNNRAVLVNERTRQQMSRIENLGQTLSVRDIGGMPIIIDGYIPLNEA